MACLMDFPPPHQKKKSRIHSVWNGNKPPQRRVWFFLKLGHHINQQDWMFHGTIITYTIAVNIVSVHIIRNDYLQLYIWILYICINQQCVAATHQASGHIWTPWICRLCSPIPTARLHVSRALWAGDWQGKAHGRGIRMVQGRRCLSRSESSWKVFIPIWRFPIHGVILQNQQFSWICSF